MKKQFLILIFLFFELNFSNAQEIELKPNFFGYNVVKDGQRLTWKEINELSDRFFE